MSVAEFQYRHGFIKLISAANKCAIAPFHSQVGLISAQHQPRLNG